jgi:cytochrome P450
VADDIPRRRNGRPPLDRDDETVRVTVNLPAKRFDELYTRAKAARMSLSEYVRDCVTRRRPDPQLIANKITLQAIEHDGRRVYRYSGTFTIGGLFEGTMCPRPLASPAGFEPALPA